VRPQLLEAIMANATELVRALAHGDRLGFLAHINSRVWEVVGGGPLGLSPAVIAALNPQPLPPVDGGRPAVSYTAVGYGQLALMAASAIGHGEGGSRSFLADIEDWCGTGWPRRWPWPPPKDLDRDDLVSLQLGAGLAAAHVAAGYEEGEMREAFENAANQLFDAALGG
jgi:hypothetical protein